ncbi:MAG: hypothetical protein HXY34_01840 [Candidatus Thorarchaeota archaeon]|nr:hypothetical protein [Candidatus Thorarchaeota archaeon]
MSLVQEDVNWAIHEANPDELKPWLSSIEVFKSSAALAVRDIGFMARSTFPKDISTYPT